MDVTSWGPGEWDAAGSVVTAVIAGVAVLFARSQVGEARKTREAQAQPFVIVSLEPNSVNYEVLDLVITNIGSTLARDVAFTFTPPLTSALDHGEHNLEDSSLVRDGIPTMPPGMRLARALDNAAPRVEAGLPWRYDVKVTFADHKGKQQEPLSYVLDLEPYLSGTYITEYSVHHVAAAMRELSGTLTSLVNGQKRLQVGVRDDDYRDWSRGWQYRHSGKLPMFGNPRPAGRSSPSKFDRLEEGSWQRRLDALRQRLAERRARGKRTIERDRGGDHRSH